MFFHHKKLQFFIPFFVSLIFLLGLSFGPSEADKFWCRKTDNRECNVDKEKCENSMVGKIECFSRPTAWCFQSQTGGGLGSDQMICVAHKADCEDWWKDRWKGFSKPTGKCLERRPDEYPTNQ